MTRRLRDAIALPVMIALCLCVSAHAGADPVPAHDSSRVKKVLVLFGGAATGLLIHESGHVLLGVSFGAHPSIKKIHFGPLPFFAIDHDPVTRRKEFVISSAGFWTQYSAAEWILSARPNLREEHAPFLKGILAFHLATSAIYSAAAFGEFGPPERDTRGMAVSLGRDGVAEPVIGAIVLAPALLDGYRYLRPGATWAKWASRAAKLVTVALIAEAGKK